MLDATVDRGCPSSLSGFGLREISEAGGKGTLSTMFPTSDMSDTYHRIGRVCETHPKNGKHASEEIVFPILPVKWIAGGRYDQNAYLTVGLRDI